MVPTERAFLQFFILLLCTINGLHSYPRNHPSLGILNELIGTDSKSPLIVVVDSNNQVNTLDDEPDQAYGHGHGQNHGQNHGQSHSKSCPNHPDHGKSFSKLSNQEYEANLYELLRTSQKMMENQARQGSSNRKEKSKGKNEKNGKNGKGKGGKKDSCESDDNNKQEFLAEQCSKSENSCGNFDGNSDKETC